MTWVNLNDVYVSKTGGGTIEGDLSVDGSITVNDGSGNGSEYNVATEISNLNDLTTVTSAPITFASGYKSYGSGYPNTVWKFGNICCMFGAVTPTANKSAAKSPVAFGTIPEGFRPAGTRYFVCQGSDMNRWTLSVAADGTVSWSRYGSSSSSSVPSGAWLVFSAVWTVSV